MSDAEARAHQTFFDGQCDLFTANMRSVTNWKQNYFGAAYSTRLEQAIRDARNSCDLMEAALEKDADYLRRVSEHATAKV